MCEKSQKFSIINTSSIEDLKKFYESSALTLEGLDLDSIGDYAEYLDSICGLKEDAKFYIVLGSTMNSVLNYRNSNYNKGFVYPEDLHIVVIMLDDLKDYQKIILKRFEFGGRWFDDVVDNNGGFVWED